MGAFVSCDATPSRLGRLCRRSWVRGFRQRRDLHREQEKEKEEDYNCLGLPEPEAPVQGPTRPDLGGGRSKLEPLRVDDGSVDDVGAAYQPGAEVRSVLVVQRVDCRV